MTSSFYGPTDVINLPCVLCGDVIILLILFCLFYSSRLLGGVGCFIVDDVITRDVTHFFHFQMCPLLLFYYSTSHCPPSLPLATPNLYDVTNALFFYLLLDSLLLRNLWPRRPKSQPAHHFFAPRQILNLYYRVSFSCDVTIACLVLFSLFLSFLSRLLHHPDPVMTSSLLLDCALLLGTTRFVMTS